MKPLFDFDPAKTKTEICLAFSYTPKVLKNHIMKRERSGLLYVLAGAYEYSWQGGAFRAEAGSLIYLPPGSVPYSYAIYAPSDGESARSMQIEFELKDACTDAPLRYASHPTILFENALFLRPRFESVVNAFPTGGASLLSLYANSLSLFSACSERSASSAPQAASKIAPAILYLNENYTKETDVGKLADLCYLSESQLFRLFKKHVGRSPIAYKNQLRITAAKKLLANPELSVGEIADMLGFYDIYAFSHFFTTATGTPPTKYRRL